MPWAGGYVGDGVGTSNLAGRTLADLILDRESDLVSLPWVGHRRRQWEPEPLRWLGIAIICLGVFVVGRTNPQTTRPAQVSLVTEEKAMAGHKVAGAE